MHPTAAAGSLERSVAAQQLRRSLQGGKDGGGDEDLLAGGPGRKLQQLSLGAPSGGWDPEDAGSSRHRCSIGIPIRIGKAIRTAQTRPALSSCGCDTGQAPVHLLWKEAARLSVRT